MKNFLFSAIGYQGLLVLALWVGTVHAQSINYLKRPDILTEITAQSSESSPTWTAFKKGMTNYLAFLFAAYPDSDLYFLARDGEAVYDAARLLTADDPELAKKIKLVPINRELVKKPEEYRGLLKHLGLEEILKSEKRSVLFVDSCCYGSVPSRIAYDYALDPEFPGADKKIFWNLITRGTDHLISNHLILEPTLGARGADDKEETTLLSLGRKMESFPHYSMGLDGIQKQGEEWTVAAGENPGEKAKSLSAMADMKHDLGNSEARKSFKEKLKIIRTLMDYSTNSRQVPLEEVSQALKKLKTESMETLGLDLITLNGLSHPKTFVRDRLIQIVKQSLEAPLGGPVDPVKLRFSHWAAHEVPKPFKKVGQGAKEYLKLHNEEYEVVDRHVTPLGLIEHKLVQGEESFQYFIPQNFEQFPHIANLGRDLVNLQKTGLKIPVVSAMVGFFLKKNLKGITGADWLKDYIDSKDPNYSGAQELRDILEKSKQLNFKVTPDAVIKVGEFWFYNKVPAEKFFTHGDHLKDFEKFYETQWGPLLLNCDRLYSLSN